jgi:hypothetical protein
MIHFLLLRDSTTGDRKCPAPAQSVRAADGIPDHVVKPSSIVGITKKDQAIGVDRPVKREIKFKERLVPQEEKR